MRERLVVLGASVFAVEVADMVRDTGEYELVRVRGEEEEINELAPLATHHLAICAETVTPLRRRLARRAEAVGFRFATVVHPLADVAPSARVGVGSLIWPRASVAAEARLGSHTLLNRGALVGHHSELAGYVTVSPGGNLGPRVTVGEGVLIGMGAIVLEDRAVGANSVIGSGAVVIRDVPERVQMLGVPAVVAKRV
jgi:acetyltransferase EpsM